MKEKLKQSKLYNLNLMFILITISITIILVLSDIIFKNIDQSILQISIYCLQFFVFIFLFQLILRVTAQPLIKNLFIIAFSLSTFFTLEYTFNTTALHLAKFYIFKSTAINPHYLGEEIFNYFAYWFLIPLVMEKLQSVFYILAAIFLLFFLVDIFTGYKFIVKIIPDKFINPVSFFILHISIFITIIYTFITLHHLNYSLIDSFFSKEKINITIVEKFFFYTNRKNKEYIYLGTENKIIKATYSKKIEQYTFEISEGT